MTTLRNAYYHIYNQLNAKYLTDVSGEDLINRVSFLSDHLYRIQAAIKIYGHDYIVPTNDNDIPIENKHLFFGCGNWSALSSQYKKV